MQPGGERDAQARRVVRRHGQVMRLGVLPDRDRLRDPGPADVGLAQVDRPGVDERPELETVAQRLPHRYREVERRGQLPVAVHVLGRERRLQEPGAPFVQAPPQAQRAGQVVGPVRVDGDAQSGRRRGHGVVRREVRLDAVAERELHGGRALGDPLAGQLGTPGVIGTRQPGDVDRHPQAEGTAQQPGDGFAGQPSLQVPQCDVDRRECVRLVPAQVPALAHEVGQPPAQHRRPAGIGAEQGRCEQVLDDGGGHLRRHGCECLTPALLPAVALQADEQRLEA